MIGIYNRGNERINGTFVQDVMKCAKPTPKVYKELSELDGDKIAIAHVSDEDWRQLIKKYSSSGDVRVRVTTGGNFSDKPWPTAENGVYTFSLVIRAGDLEAEDWKEVLSGLSVQGNVEALVRGENPNGLRRFFVHEVQEHLSALTFLCEGYLAVHAENTGYNEDIRPALELMKWGEFRESERGQNLIRQHLGEKVSVVQQPQWWLEVFEQKSFYEDVNKEWKYATGVEEIPSALNDLLKAIRSGESDVPPNIVAEAYCVLKKKMITAPSEWQTRRNKFNHDWLKNKFLNSFNDFVEQIQKRKPDLVRVSEFLAEDFPAWTSQQQEVQWIVQSFEDSMSPQQLLNSFPLNRCNDETREWLGPLTHRLWLSRYPVKEKSKESQDALIEVNKMYEKLASELEQSMPIGLTKLIALHPKFCELKESYETLSKTLSNLSRDESYDG